MLLKAGGYFLANTLDISMRWRTKQQHQQTQGTAIRLVALLADVDRLELDGIDCICRKKRGNPSGVGWKASLSNK